MARGAQLNGSCQRLRIRRELRPPELVAHDRHRRGTLAPVVFLQQPPERRLDTQGIEGVGGHDGSFDTERLPFAQAGGLEAAEAGQRFERALARAQIDEVADRDIGLGETRSHVAMPEHDELLGLGEWQRPQQDGFDHGEQRGVRADPEREGDNGGGREGRLTPEEPKRLAYVVGPHGPLRREDRPEC